MSKHTTVECKSCGSNMVPRVIYGRTTGFSSIHKGMAGTCCPVCLSEHWKGDKGMLEGLVDVINLNPWVIVLAVAMVPMALFFLLFLVLLLIFTPALVIGVFEGNSLAELIRQYDLGMAVTVVMLGFVCMSAVAYYIPFLIRR